MALSENADWSKNKIDSEWQHKIPRVSSRQRRANSDFSSMETIIESQVLKELSPYVFSIRIRFAKIGKMAERNSTKILLWGIGTFLALAAIAAVLAVPILLYRPESTETGSATTQLPEVPESSSSEPSSSPSSSTTTTLLETTTSEASTVTTTTELIPIEPGDVFILVITSDLDKIYLESGDGSSQVSATIEAPNNENSYAFEAAYALVHGNLHIFGGYCDGKKIARLDGCTFTELPARLNIEREHGHAALSINDGTQALICFGNGIRSCELFSGSTAVLSTFSTNWTHAYVDLGLYKDQPTTIGCMYEKNTKTETLSSSGWTSVADHPLRISDHTLVGLENKSMLLLGGATGYDGQDHHTGIWQLHNDEWSKIGELLERAADASALYIGSYIYFFAVNYHYDTLPIQRIDMSKDEEIEKVEMIGYQPGFFYLPILFQTASDYCV